MTLAVGQILRPGDFSGTSGSPSIVGSSNQLGDDDDVTYIDLLSSAEAIYGFFGRFDKVQANLANADAGYPGSPLLVDLWIRASANRPDPGTIPYVAVVATVDLPTLTGDIALNMEVPADGAVHEVAVDISPYYASWFHTIDQVVNDLEAGTPTVALSNAIVGFAEAQSPQTSRVYEWALRIWYDAPAVKPILRVHPRDDGRGASSAGRVYPQPRSRQASNRVAGSTYL